MTNRIDSREKLVDELAEYLSQVFGEGDGGQKHEFLANQTLNYFDRLGLAIVPKELTPLMNYEMYLVNGLRHNGKAFSAALYASPFRKDG